MGPPAAGKSSWVRQWARPGDIVIDFDRLATALTGEGADAHRHDKRVRQVAYAARRAAINAALGICRRVDVYLIDSDPTDEAMARYRAAKARLVTVDPGRDVVLARCRAMRSRWALQAAKRWYASGKGVDPRPQTSRDW